RSIHITVPAAEIAPSGHRPKYALYISIMIILIVLICIQWMGLAARLDPAVRFALLQSLFQRLVQQAARQLRFSIAKSQRLKLCLFQRLDVVSGSLNQDPSFLFPAAQNVSCFQPIVHDLPHVYNSYKNWQTDMVMCLPVRTRLLLLPAIYPQLGPQVGELEPVPLLQGPPQAVLT